MAYECIGEFWYDDTPGIKRLRPRWVHPCNPELYLLGAMRVKPSGPGAGKLVPIYYDTDDTCHEVEWSGHCTKKDGKLKPVLLLECECGPIIGYDCMSCFPENCPGDICDYTWDPGSTPLNLDIEFNGIQIIGGVLTSEQVNSAFVFSQSAWWWDKDQDTYPDFFRNWLGNPWSLPDPTCYWIYADDSIKLYGHFSMQPGSGTFTQLMLYYGFPMNADGRLYFANEHGMCKSPLPDNSWSGYPLRVGKYGSGTATISF